MAIFHFSAKVISRGKGQSAIAAAAYRSGELLRDEQADEQKFYTSRAERIVFTDIMAPKDAPEWAHDRNALWNNAERAEKRKDAQLAREIEVALPHEMTDQQREYLVKDFAREAFVRKGYAVDIAIHAPDKDSDSRNYHAHLMVTMRTVDSDGFAAKKDRSLNSSEQLGEWREQFAHLTNRHLERHGIDARVDHRSLKEQGIEREPTVHVGYAGMEIAARGGESDRYRALQDIIARNDIRVEMKGIEREIETLDRPGAAWADEVKRSKSRSDDSGLEWTDRAGMTAQMDAAIKAVKDRGAEASRQSAWVEKRAREGTADKEAKERSSREPGTKPKRDPGEKQLKFFEDRNPDKDFDRER